ncbi:P-loop containing nucleoside triphosphate hydrolase protein [Cokeromyces recurvatus]|uniref:P-loop containing nucleoside triphosphate hydrolase protein n=1 Tax=Cokeromyces recurvatus TaxID=90255 RepID=UPI00221EE61B|nr:P-loop containing nucleoside triphosphate hydrolase protein [Cokeromyces recurvatus]KAI7906746.1 P-loop containing nucleoside triphosphate hydrolase protein [Cokeromyces recurvatus]
MKLANFFKQIKQHSMSILILDELDMIAGKWTSKKSALDIRLASMLMMLIDDLKNAYIIGITSRLHAIDTSFLRSGRLDDLQIMSVKTPKQRYEILNILTKKLPFKSCQEGHEILEDISKITHGFVSSDLESLSSFTTLLYIKQQAPFITHEHFIQTLATIKKPSNLNEYSTQIPTIRFNDIYGMDDIIQEIKASVIQPFHHPEHYHYLGITPPKGILIHGPTGVGKTMLCCALASEVGVNFMLVESSQVRSKIIGESEKSLAKLFQQARANSPCILFIDQIDMLLPKRGTSQSTENTSDRIVTGFLTEMDGLLTKAGNTHIDVLVVAATNRIEAIDNAVLRPGRFDEHIYIPLPNDKQRKEIIQGISSKMPIDLSEQEIEDLVNKTQHWSGAQLDNLFREAALTSIRENINNERISNLHLMKSFLK